MINTVEIERSRLSVRGSCLFDFHEDTLSTTTFTSLCQFRGFKCPARHTTKLSTPVPILSVFSPISTTARARVRNSRPINKGQVFRGNHAENNFLFATSNNDGRCYSDRRDQCTTITKCASLAVLSIADRPISPDSAENAGGTVPVTAGT